MDVPYVFWIMGCAYAASGEPTPLVPPCLDKKKHEFLTILMLNLSVGRGIHPARSIFAPISNDLPIKTMCYIAFLNVRDTDPSNGK